MTLLELYKSLMDTAGMVVTKDYLVSGVIRSKEDGKVHTNIMPVTIKGDRLALPAPEILSIQDKKAAGVVVFHPLMEPVGRGESEILEKLRNALMYRLNDVAASLLVELTVITGDVDSQSTMTPDQVEFLTKVKGVDDDFLKKLGKILDQMPHDQTARRIVTFFLKKTGSVGDKRYKRVGVVTFPLYEELHKPPVVTMVPSTKKGEKDTKKTEYDVYGVKCRVKDRELLIALLEYIFPNINVPGAYNKGSDSDIAANMDALMHAVLGVIEALNSVTETFEDRIEQDEALFINADWKETFLNLDVMLNEIRKVPMQAGNEGTTADEPAGHVKATPQHAGLHVPVAASPQGNPHAITPAQVGSYPAPVAPVQQHTTIPQQQTNAPANGTSLEGFLAQREQERARQQQMEQGWKAVTHMGAAPPPMQQPPYNPAAAFMPAGQPVYYPQQQPMMMAQPVNTGRGLDFGSVLATNPSVMYATGGPQMGMVQQPPQQTSRYFSQFVGGGQPMMQQQQPMQQGYYPVQPQGYQRSI